MRDPQTLRHDFVRRPARPLMPPATRGAIRDHAAAALMCGARTAAGMCGACAEAHWPGGKEEKT